MRGWLVGDLLCGVAAPFTAVWESEATRRETMGTNMTTIEVFTLLILSCCVVVKQKIKHKLIQQHSTV
jgi:hypothetical protein